MDLDPSWSLNRVFIADLPGLDVPDTVRAKTAYELLAAQSLSRLIRKHISQLHLAPNLTEHELHLAFDACLKSDNPAIRAAASDIARRFGRSLGYVLLTLKRGDQANRNARPEWNANHWSHWATIKRVWLGGGLVSGNLGQQAARHANWVIREAGAEDYLVQVSPHGAALPLVGAARHVPPGADSAVVLDFGGTAIKRARVTLAHNKIAALHRLPNHPVGWTSSTTHDASPQERATDLIGDMTSIIAETWRDVGLTGRSGARVIPVCIAAYVKDGNPLTGTYGQVGLVTDNLETELGLRLSGELGTSIRIMLLHDGTAAAAAFAGQRHTAVVMMGTALGVGFPGDGTALRAFSDAFA